jgi:plasmid stabilization system protein ParE
VKVRFLAKARADLSAAVQHVAKDNPTAAQELAERILAVIKRLASGEFEGPECQLTSGRVVHSWPVPPLRIYYRRSNCSPEKGL